MHLFTLRNSFIFNSFDITHPTTNMSAPSLIDIVHSCIRHIQEQKPLFLYHVVIFSFLTFQRDSVSLTILQSNLNILILKFTMDISFGLIFMIICSIIIGEDIHRLYYEFATQKNVQGTSQTPPFHEFHQTS